jgi:hypothetical protein
MSTSAVALLNTTKWLGRTGDRSPIATAEVKNEKSFVFTPVRFLGVELNYREGKFYIITQNL